MKQIRFSHTERKTRILAAALPVAVSLGYKNVTRSVVAKAAEVAENTIQHHFGSIPKLKEAILAYAIEKRNLEVIAQAVVARDPAVSDLPDRLKARALATMR